MNPPTLTAFTTDVLALDLSPAQRVLLACIAGEPLDAETRPLAERFAGGVPEGPQGEAFLLCGRGSGVTSRILAPVVLWEALFRVASGRTFAVFGAPLYETIRELAESRLSRSFEKTTGPRLRLRNGVLIRDCSSGLPRIPLGGAAFDSPADWNAERDAEARAGMVAAPNAKLVRVAGRYDSPPDGAFIWRAPATEMNPALSAEQLERLRTTHKQYAEREVLVDGPQLVHRSEARTVAEIMAGERAGEADPDAPGEWVPSLESLLDD